MTSYPISRLALLTALGIALASQAKAGAINDPVIALVGAGPQQQTVKVSVTITGAPGGTALYYTTDGTTPSMSSPPITSGSTLLVPQNATLQVEAFQSATSTSNIVTEKLTLAGQVSAGTAHTLFLKNDGSVWASGDNSAGELGNGTTNNSTIPVQVMTNPSTHLTGIVAVAAGNNESFAVDNNGKVWAWGLNANGQLALGTTGNTPFATLVTSSNVTNMIGIAASQYHTVALRADGTVWAWGSDVSGETGNGTTSAWITTPTEVLAPSGQSGHLAGIVAVAAGTNHSLALTSGGNAYSWGYDADGELADGDAGLASQSLPVQVLQSGTPLSNVVAVAAGTSNSYFLRNDGTAWSAGRNSLGELGQGTASTSPTTANESAGQVVDLTGVSLVALSDQCTLDSTGTLWTWGDNSTAKLGVGFTGYYATAPLAVTLGAQATPAVSVAGGNNQTVTDGNFSAAIQLTTTPNTWVNFIVNPAFGALGLNTTGGPLSPIIGGYTNSSGQISFYLDANANNSGTVPLTATSGATSTGLSVVEQTAQNIVSSGEPTMPQALIIVLAVSLIFVAIRRKTLIAS